MKPYIKSLPADLTTYDLLKFLAVTTMIIDHIGLYFFPEQNEWRAVGRMSMPLWLFLVGYANTRDIPPVLWAGALILFAGYLMAGNALLPLNILFTIIIARAVLDTLAKITFRNLEGFLIGMTAMFLIAIPTAALFDYGTTALLWALFGYVLRHHKEMGWAQNRVIGFGFLTAIIYVMYQYLFFGFNFIETIIVMAGVAVSSIIMYKFKPIVLSDMTPRIPNIIVSLLKFSGRKTLYIYVAHILLFLGIAFFMYPEKFGLFHLKFY